MRVRVPASSANLGPGFDALGMALTLYVEVGIVGVDHPVHRALDADVHHPATVAFVRAGGSGRLWIRSEVPSGRGLGFSGAVRVAGILAAMTQRGEPDRGAALALATELEGHPDNVAASLLGGVVVTAAGRAVRVPLAVDPAVVMWIPSTQTLTDQSRGVLPAQVPFADAVFNVGRASLLVAALAAGDTEALRDATADRLHQDARLARSPGSAGAMEALLSGGAWAAWLSGSGPSVAALCPRGRADAVAATLPPGGRTAILGIDAGGAEVVV